MLQKRKTLLKQFFNFCSLCCCFYFLNSCETGSRLPTVDFAAPTGMVLAGESFDQVFIANPGMHAVQIMQLSANMANVDMVKGPIRYFPRSIPTGAQSYPSQLAATEDGRYVVVLDTLSAMVSLIDTQSLQVVADPNQPQNLSDPNNRGLTLLMDGSQSQPIDLVASPIACLLENIPPNVLPPDTSITRCLGKFYVSLSGTGNIAILDVLQTATGTVQPIVELLITMGGAPSRLAVHPSGETLFATDAQASSLIRIIGLQEAGSTPPVADRLPLSGIANTLAISTDGGFVVAGLAVTRDVAVLSSTTSDTLQGDLQIVNTNPVFTPAPMCIQDCADPNANACSLAHPADQALCLGSTGLTQSASGPYTATYLGGIPAYMLPLGDPTHLLSIGCSNKNTNVVQNFSSAIAITTLDGALYFLGLRDAQGNQAIELISLNQCLPPTLTFSRKEQPPSTILATCPSIPGSQRLACAVDNSPASVPGLNQGVAILPGQANGLTFDLLWEGVLPGLEQGTGGGTIGDNGQFTDIHLPLASMNIIPGDILEILTKPILGPKCLEAGGANTCMRERRIVGIDVDTNTNIAWLQLDTPLLPACYPGANLISYRIRAGSTFVVQQTLGEGMGFTRDAWSSGYDNLPVMRLAPGNWYGMGYTAEPSSVLFGIQNLPVAQSTVSGCDVYDNSGAVLANAPQDKRLARNVHYDFTIVDNYQVLKSGALGTSANQAGRRAQLPGSMALTRPQTTAAPWLLISYIGADSVMLLNPYNLDALSNSDVPFRVLQ